MTTREYLDEWRASGRITGDQYDILSALASRRRLSLFLEINALLYLGVLAVAAGLAWTAAAYGKQWGDLAVLGPATGLLIACSYYCLMRVPPYSHDYVPAPTLAFDYLLYLACLTFAVELGYVEYRFAILRAQWDFYVLGSAAVYFVVAYRFDNRLVLTLAIATLAAWFGLRLSRFWFLAGSQLRVAALAYALVTAGIGATLHNAGIKRHFFETYLHVAVNVLLAALLSGVVAGATAPLWIVALLLAAGVVVAGGLQFRLFAFVVYGALYGYAGVAVDVLRRVSSATAGLLFIVVSAGAVIAGLVMVARHLGREE